MQLHRKAKPCKGSACVHALVGQRQRSSDCSLMSVSARRRHGSLQMLSAHQITTPGQPKGTTGRAQRLVAAAALWKLARLSSICLLWLKVPRVSISGTFAKFHSARDRAPQETDFLRLGATSIRTRSPCTSQLLMLWLVFAPGPSVVCASPTSVPSLTVPPSNARYQAHKHSPSRRLHLHAPQQSMPPTMSSAPDVSSLLIGTRFHDLLGRSLQQAEVGLSAKFANGRADETERLFVCTHKCADAGRCPELAVSAQATRLLVRSLHPPPLVNRWLDIFDTELRDRPALLPQLCVGEARGSGKLYIGGTHRNGGGYFPDLPLARASGLHSVFPELSPANRTQQAEEGTLFSIEWSSQGIAPTGDESSPKVTLRRSACSRVR